MNTHTLPPTNAARVANQHTAGVVGAQPVSALNHVAVRDSRTPAVAPLAAGGPLAERLMGSAAALRD